MTVTAHALLPIALVTPLVLTALTAIRSRPIQLLPWAGLPGFAAAIFVPYDEPVHVEALLLGLTIEMDRIGAVFLGVSSLIWILGGAYARSYMPVGGNARSFSVFWLLTLTGTIGTFVAADVATFYTAFALASVAAYGLIVHERTHAARRAAAIYIGFVVVGEACLFGSLSVAAVHADSLLIDDVRASLFSSPWRDYVMGGILVGFGLKAGLAPLHVWLPLAHPAAPTPASAVLSGVIVKCGIVGLLRFLPLPELLPDWGDALVVAGLITAYYGVAAGLGQSESKAVLAYSTVSQMGLIVAVIGTGFWAYDDRALDLATLYAAHHGVAKGALFLGIGVVARSSGRARWLTLAAMAFLALSMAGAPLSGGALAKLAIAGIFGEGVLASFAAMTVLGTALLMARFLIVLAREPRPRAGNAPPRGQVLPWAALSVFAIVIPWALFGDLAPLPREDALQWANLWAGFWPLLLVGFAWAIIIRYPRLPPFALPPGDIVVVAETLLRSLGRVSRASASLIIAKGWRVRAVPLKSMIRVLDSVERRFSQWRVAAALTVIVALILGVALTRS